MVLPYVTRRVRMGPERSYYTVPKPQYKEVPKFAISTKITTLQNWKLCQDDVQGWKELLSSDTTRNDTCT